MTSHPLHLERDLVCFDTETTGTDLNLDRVVQIALVRLRPNGERVEWETLVNPEMPIPEESRQIHGISNEMVAGAPTFAELAPSLLQRFRDCDLSGYNVLRFDLPLLKNEFQRARLEWNLDGVRVIDAQAIFHKMEPRDLTAAYRFYCGQELVGAHGALADTRATLDVLLGQLEHYRELPREVAALDALFNAPDRRFVDSGRRFRWRDGEVCFNFGNHRGKLLREVVDQTPEYLDWIIHRDFPADVKKLCTDALRGIYPRSPDASASGAGEAADAGAAAGIDRGGPTQPGLFGPPQ